MMVYRYGALKPKVLGSSGEVLPFETLLDYQRLSNRFYNALIEVERWRIAARFVVELLQNDGLTDEQKTEHRLAYNADCRAAGKATTIGWGQKQAVTEMVAGAMKTRRADEFKAEKKATAKNWHWLKRVMAIPRPRYRRYDGDGLLAATVQGCSDFTVEKALTGSSPQLAITGSGKHRVCLLRLKDGLSLEVPIVYHRDLPPEARIIFARLCIDRIGDRWIYSVHLTVDAAPQKRQMGIGKCAINFGWRRVEGGIRVAYAVGTDGEEHELVLPDRLFGRMQHAESLRSLADEVADKYLGDGARRAKSRALALSAPSATHRELGRVRFTLEQAEKHSVKDAEHWARRDRHLYQWERNEYSGALRSRREIYRLWARKMASLYDSCVVETFDMRSVIARGAQEIPAARHYRFLVGPHYLRAEVKSVFGESCEVLKPAKHTQNCHVCGKRCKWDKARELMHDCEHCGASWDQDQGNCLNQLAAVAAE